MGFIKSDHWVWLEYLFECLLKNFFQILVDYTYVVHILDIQQYKRGIFFLRHLSISVISYS